MYILNYHMPVWNTGILLKNIALISTMQTALPCKINTSLYLAKRHVEFTQTDEEHCVQYEGWTLNGTLLWSLS